MSLWLPARRCHGRALTTPTPANHRNPRSIPDSPRLIRRNHQQPALWNFVFVMKAAWLLFIWTLLVAVGNASVLLTAENPWEGAVVVQQTPVLARDCSVSSTWDLWVKPSFWPPTSTTYFLSQSAEGESLDTNYLVAVRYTYLTQHTTHTHTHTSSSHHPHSPYTDHTCEQTYKTLPPLLPTSFICRIAGFFDQFIRNFFSDVVPQYPHILAVPPFPIHARLSPFHTHNTHVVYVYSLCSTCLNVVYVFIFPPPSTIRAL